MTRDVVLGNSYSQEGLIRATANGYLFDYIATWYYQMSKEDLKEVLLAILGAGYDSCKSDEDEEAYNELLIGELESRYFGLDED